VLQGMQACAPEQTPSPACCLAGHPQDEATTPGDLRFRFTWDEACRYGHFIQCCPDGPRPPPSLHHVGAVRPHLAPGPSAAGASGALTGCRLGAPRQGWGDPRCHLQGKVHCHCTSFNSDDERMYTVSPTDAHLTSQTG
jgi:hypothetical protein